MNRTHRTLPFALVLTLTQSAFAQEDAASAPQETAPPPPSEQLPPPSAELRLFVQHTLDANFSDAPGDVGVLRGGAGVEFTFPVTQRSRVSLDLLGERSWYSFNDATGFVGSVSEPWDEVLTTSATLSFSNQLDGRWAYFVGLGVESSLEDGAEFQDSLTYGGMIGGMYAVDERLRVGLGLRVQTRLEDSALVVPLPALFWQIDEQWRLATRPRVSGFAVELAFSATDEVTLHAEAGVEGRAFRLDEDGAAPDGVGREWRVPVAIGATWTPREQVRVSATLGVVAWQEYTLDDAGGDEIGKLETDPAAYGSLGVTITF